MRTVLRAISLGFLGLLGLGVLLGSGVVPGAYNLIENSGSPLTRYSTLNFVNGGCVNNAGSQRTDCTVLTSIPGNYTQSFTSQTSVVLAHNLNTLAVTVQCYSSASPAVWILPTSITLTDVNDVTVTFSSAQSGNCVVNGSSGSGGGGSVVGGNCTSPMFVQGIAASTAVPTCATPSGGGGIANGYGLCSARPSGTTVGDMYVASDTAVSLFRWSGSAWAPFVAGIGVTAPSTATLTSAVAGTNATVTSWANTGCAGGGVTLGGTNSNSSTDALIGQFESLPSPPYTVYLRFYSTGLRNNDNSWVGLSLRDSGSGKLLLWGPYQNIMRGGYWVSANGFNTNYCANNYYYNWGRGGLTTMVIRDDGTNRTSYTSNDGVTINSACVTSDTDDLTPNQAGIIVSPYNGTVQMTAVDLTITTP